MRVVFIPERDQETLQSKRQIKSKRNETKSKGRRKKLRTGDRHKNKKKK